MTNVGSRTFKAGKRKVQKGKNPQNGAAIKIKAKNAAKFVGGKG